MRKIFLFLFISFQISAQAFTLTNSNYPGMKGWNTNILIFHLNPANCRSDIRSLIQDAMNLWNSIPSSKLKLELGSDSAATAAQAAANSAPEEAVIVCDAAFGTTFPTADPNQVAGVGVNYLDSVSSQTIYRGYLSLNAQPAASASMNALDETSAKIIIAHEIGHVLGLGHSSDESALMYYSTGVKADFNLSEDDVNGMTYLYGRDEFFKDPFLGGCASVSAGGGKIPPGSMLALVCMMFLPVFVSLRYRTRRYFI